MTRKPRKIDLKLATQGARILSRQIERLSRTTGVPYSDFVYYLLYQTEVSTGCLMYRDAVRSRDEVVQNNMTEVLDESHDAAIDDGGNFISDYFDQLLRVGKAWDPEFSLPLEKRSDYAKHTQEIKRTQRKK